MQVNEIFLSIEGEGIRTGYPVVFIRLFGCNLHCSYCDTRYACEGDDYRDLDVFEIYEEVKKFKVNKITITGGEPLIHKDDFYNLIDYLCLKGYEINIETNGSISIERLMLFKNLIITMDYKSISSGMNHKMFFNNLYLLRSYDVLKFVVGSLEDLDDMKSIIRQYNIKGNIFVSPVFGKIEPKDLVKYIIDNSLNECRIQLQLHKFIWEPSKRGV